MKNLLLGCFVVLTSIAFGQKATISGTIKDATNGEDLFGASVVVQELSGVGAKANAYGFYSLTLDTGKYTLIYRSIGFEPVAFEVELKGDITKNIELGLPKDVQEIEEVVVSAVKENDNITSSEMDVTKFTPKDIETIPVIFGEKDIVKTLQLTPSVKAAGEGNAGFYVRGGGADQNLVLLDEAPVYNPSHLLGFFSVFNSDAIKDVALYKSGVPAEYGGRSSSVMDIKMKEGSNKKFGFSGGIGLIASRLAIEGPIVKDKGSFIVSGRRTYADVFLGLSKREELKDTRLFFYDINAKANYKISDKDRIFISGYFGRDVLKFGDQFGTDWGNATGTLRYNRVVTKKMFSNTTVVFSNFNYGFKIGNDDQSFGVSSSIQDWNVKQDFSWFANKNNTIKFGVNGMHHQFKPGSLTASGSSSFNEIKLPNQYGIEYGAYIQNDQKIGSRFSLNYGLRYTGFVYVGSKTYDYTQNGTFVSEETHDRWESGSFHHGLEPRLSMSFILSENNSIKLGYHRIFQYLHQLSNSTTSNPTDIWVPSTNNVKPQIADQIALGYYQNFGKNMFKLSAEIYYKHMQNQIDYRNGADLFLNEFIEGDLVYGTGRSYGLELQLKKTKGKVTGWISYALSRSLRTFDQINQGKEFSARQDRIHDLSVVVMYKINKKLALAGTFVFNTGDAVTFPSGKYIINGEPVAYYTERNGYRMPNYHRMDLGLTIYFKEKKRYSHNLNISIYNVYSQENAFTITFEENDGGDLEAIQTSLFKMVPSLTYNFNFK